MMGRPSAILEIIWIVWLCSWVAASFWSGRTQSWIGARDTWTYRAVMIVGGILLVPITARVLGETRGVGGEEIARQTSENFFRLFTKAPRAAMKAA